MGVLRILSTLRSAGSAGLAVAERVAARADARTPAPEDVQPPLLAPFPSQAESAALLDPDYLWSAGKAGAR